MGEIRLESDGLIEFVYIQGESVTLEEVVEAIETQSSWTAKTANGTITCIPPDHGTVLGARSYDRGHEMRWDDDKGWIYTDTEEPQEKRNCIRCGKPPTPEGYDACLGYLPGVQNACCGHGVLDPIRIYKEWKWAIQK